MKKRKLILYLLVPIFGFLLGTNLISKVPNVKGASANTLTNAIIGSIQIYSGTSVPTGYLECNGQAVSRTTYSKLYAIIGTKYGSGDGSTTFNLPNLSGRVAMGSSSSYTIGSKGGEYTHALTETEMPSHTHTFTGNQTTTGSTANLSGSASFSGSSTPSSADGSHSHNIVSNTGNTDFIVGNSVGQSNKAIIPLGASAWGSHGSAHWFTGVYSAAAGGAHAHTVTPSGTISVSDTHTHDGGTTSGTNSNTGSGSKHNNIQPYNTVMYVIKY
ncbi:MAG: hypothetical protein E7157_02645 [Lactobacillales bacterium]|nr:hypothetical protein [Lactobacillales bacterium]